MDNVSYFKLYLVISLLSKYGILSIVITVTHPLHVGDPTLVPTQEIQLSNSKQNYVLYLYIDGINEYLSNEKAWDGIKLDQDMSMTSTVNR